MRIKGVLAFIKNNNLTFILIISLLGGGRNAAYAQLCSGSLGDPVFKIDFGQGASTHAGALPAGITSYSYSSSDFPNDGSYTIENTTAGSGNVWWSTTDHTGNSGGYMMVVNAATLKTDYFYKTTVKGLCPGTTFEFAAWVANLIRTNDVSPPNITFSIFSAIDGRPLGSATTGNIAVSTSGLQWKQYAVTFKTPPGETDVIVQMTNNSAGGIPGNDLVLDDITFRPCGPVVTSAFVATTGQTLTEVACEGQPLNYTLTSNVQTGVYNTPAYQWQVNTGAAWVNITGATANTYNVNIASAVAGTYKYRMLTVEAANIGSTSCQVASNELTLTVTAAPAAKFDAVLNNSNCLLSIFDFKDQSTSGTPISTWDWDFDDPTSGAFNTSNAKNPSHTFLVSRTHNVTLTIHTSGTCDGFTSLPVQSEVKLKADFITTASICPNAIVTFTDKSTAPANDQIGDWLWNFGDGTTETRHDNLPFTHAYVTTGDYTVTLEVITKTARCVSDLNTQIIKVVTVNFEVCPGDVTQFTDLTGKTGNPSLIYSWNFGDPASGSSNTSALPNPTHQYTGAATYNATLTVSSLNGCAPATHTEQVVISATPLAKFDIENRNNLCGADSVAFDDLSAVNDKITKLVWYFDIDNNPAGTVVAIRSDKKYHHFYGVNNTNLPITYHAMLVAYTATGCPYATIRQDVIINPTPVVTLTVNGATLVSPVALCPADNSITITAQSNVPGSGVFNGKGISAQGVFDPKVSDAGTFTINYIFTAANSGCGTRSSFDVVVNPVPVITLVTTANALEGGQTTLNPTVTGSNLTYLWSPTVGVSNPAILNPVFSPTQQTTYTLTATPAKGCQASAQVVVSVLKLPIVPNAFTPNNDGVNDTWDIKYLNSYPDATVEVFNRYGAKVYSSNGYAIPWDGKFKGANLPFGVYYYVINPKRGRTAMTGSLTIIK
jgi:gliding motility-associated-like protein